VAQTFCNDGRCPRTRSGEEIHTIHSLNIKKIRRNYALDGISILLLLTGLNFGVLSFTIDGLNQMGFAYKCVYDAVYANATSDEYMKCSQNGIDVWFKSYYIQIISTIFLAVSAIIGLLRRRD
jgi:hypothetical protein